MIVRLIIGWVLAWADPSTGELAAGALRTAPSYLTADTAPEHARAAVIAANVYDVDPALLLSIAWHESRYQLATVTPEAGGKVSCGPMTPVPTSNSAECIGATSSLVGGYLAGAAHLRAWLHATRGSLSSALTGYAGGGYLIRLCREDDSYRACGTAAVFLERAARIRWRPAT